MRLRLLETCLWGVVGWGGVIAETLATQGKTKDPHSEGGIQGKLRSGEENSVTPGFLRKHVKLST